MNWDEPRLWSNIVADPSGCWLWTGHIQSGGYGTCRVNGSARYAHRVLYELFIGPIPSGLQIDHLCRVRNCVHPLHLEPVTSRENTLRGTGPSAQRATATQCLRGHLFDEVNTRHYRGWRYCRACHNQGERKRRAA